MSMLPTRTCQRLAPSLSSILGSPDETPEDLQRLKVHSLTVLYHVKAMTINSEPMNMVLEVMITNQESQVPVELYITDIFLLEISSE